MTVDRELEMFTLEQIKDEFIGKIGTEKRDRYEQELSKLENNTTNITMETVLKVFGALKAKVIFNVELLNNPIG